MTFQIEKMKVLRDNTVKSAGKPVQVILGLCDVVMEILAEMQMNSVRELAVKMGDESKSLRERRIEVMEMLQICANELENKTLFPSIDQTEIVLPLGTDPGKTIERNASFLIRRIIQKVED